MKKTFLLLAVLLVSITHISAKTIYLDANDNYWNQADAKFAVYNVDTETFSDFMTLVAGETSIYEIEIPEDLVNLAFYRYSPLATVTGIENTWNQTNALELPTDNNIFVIDSWWGGDWSNYVIETKLLLHVAQEIFIDESIEATASTNVENPTYTFSVKSPEATEYEIVEMPYTPTGLGVYMVKVTMSVGEEVFTQEASVLVSPLPEPITIRVKVPEEWQDTITFYYWNDYHTPNIHVPATEVEEGVYEYTFERFYPLNFIAVNGIFWGDLTDQTNDVTGVTASATYEIGEVDTLTYKRSIYNEPQLFLNLPKLCILGDSIDGEASSLYIENPEYSYSVQTPDSTITENITFPYTPTEVGIYLFCASVETASGGILTATATVTVTTDSPEDAITIRVKVPEVWTDTISFYSWNPTEGTAGFVTATLADDGLYEQTFQTSPLNFIVVNGTNWSYTDYQTNDVTGVTTSTTYEIGEIDPLTYKRAIYSEPHIMFNLPEQCFVGDAIDGAATSVLIENPEYSYSVQTPDSSITENISFPYIPTIEGTYLFRASVETALGEVLATTATVTVTERESITIRVKEPEEWTDTISFYSWNPTEGTAGFVTATLADDGLYEYTFNLATPLNFIVVNGTTWSSLNNQTNDVTDVIVSNTYEIGTIDPLTYKRYIFSEPHIMFSLAGQCFLDETIDGAATSVFIENPVYSYSVQTPSSDEMSEITLPYTPTEEGIHLFQATVTTTSGEVLEAYAAVMASPVPDPITIRVKTPEEWSDTITFIIWNMYTNTYSITANKAVDGLHEYTFERFCPINLVAQNGIYWSPEPGNHTITVENITESSTFEVGDIYTDESDASTYNMRAITLVEEAMGVGNRGQSKDVNIYSDTANQNIVVTLNGSEELYILDLLGRVVINTTVTEQATININHLPTGIYLIHMAGITEKWVIR